MLLLLAIAVALAHVLLSFLAIAYALVDGDCCRSLCTALLSLAIAFGLVVGDCYRSLRTVLLSLLAIAVALAYCALAAPRGSARVGTPQLATTTTTTTSRELEQKRDCGKKNENKSKKSLQQSSLQLHSVENR
jgi:hypothetical protein